MKMAPLHRMDTAQATVGDLMVEINAAIRWMGKKNPNRRVLAKCGVALHDLANRVAAEKARADAAEARLEAL